MSQERLEALEIKAAYQEDLLQHLNKQVFDQQNIIDQLQKAFIGMSARLKDLSEGGTDSGGHELPPHY